MIIDKELELSNAQAITTSAASTNYVDLGVARDVGVGGGLQVMVTVTETVTATDAATVTFALEKDDATNFPSAVVAASSGAIGKATLVAGYQFFIPIPVGTDERYLQMKYTVATGPLTAGKFTAQIVQGVQKNKHYPNAI